MKFSALLLLIILSCSSIDHIVESDYSYSGNFKRYENFDIAKNLVFEGSDEQAQLIESGITEILVNWGYEKTEIKPDLIISYNLYSKSFDMIGFDQPEFQHWISTSYPKIVFEDSIQSFEKNLNFDDSYEKRPTYMKEGTIHITFFDRRRKVVVWQGYSSGYFESDQFMSKYDFKSVITRVLYEYRLLAKNRIKS